MAEAGSYLYFVAYGVEGESRLLFTPDPAQITVTESDVLPDDTTSVAAETFEAELESAVVQAKCILCHVEGGLARNSSLQFQRTNTASALGRENVMITPHPATRNWATRKKPEPTLPQIIRRRAGRRRQKRNR